MFKSTPGRRARSIALGLLLAAPMAGAQTGNLAGPPVHVAEFGRYTLRANAIPSDLLPAASARKHGIERARDRGVLNLVVLERRPDGSQATVAAEVAARQENLLGQSDAVEMRAIRENSRVSYLGTFGFAPLRNFRFMLRVRPAGSDETLTTAFEDRFVVRDK